MKRGQRWAVRVHEGPRGDELSEGAMRGRLGLLWASGGHVKLRGPQRAEDGHWGLLEAAESLEGLRGATGGRQGLLRTIC
jgi:hypothetical protein